VGRSHLVAPSSCRDQPCPQSAAQWSVVQLPRNGSHPGAPPREHRHNRFDRYAVLPREAAVLGTQHWVAREDHRSQLADARQRPTPASLPLGVPGDHYSVRIDEPASSAAPTALSWLQPARRRLASLSLWGGVYWLRDSSEYPLSRLSPAPVPARPPSGSRATFGACVDPRW
jgi:hypothetical protein